MAGRASEQLRQLVGDYYHGLTTRDSYRERRAELLDNIGAENDEAPESTDRPKPARERAPVAPAPTEPGAPASSFTPKRLVIGTVVLAGVVAATYAVFVLGPGSGLMPASTDVEQEVIEEISTDLADALVAEFLGRNDWGEESLNNFQLAWGALDDGQRQRATEGRRYRRLTSALHQRIREDIALGGTPDGGRLESLLSFATAMGSPYRVSRTSSIEQTAGSEGSTAAEVQDVRSPDRATAEVEAEEAAPAQISKTDEPVDGPLPDPEAAPAATIEKADRADDPCPRDIASTRQPYCKDILTDGSAGPLLVVLPTGTFAMGSDSVESESPIHQVEIAYHIAFSRYEITAQEYAQFCAATSLPCADQPWEDDSPVVSVSWDDATLYAEWLSDMTGFAYRLPSEAEWEFAARAGTESPYSFGDEITPSAAHSSVNGATDAPLSKTNRNINRNPFRLFHMSGNVREWTQDAWYPNYDDAPGDGSARQHETQDLRTVRGGSYSDPGTKLRSAAREPLERAHRDTMTGIRLVREIF